MALTNGQENFSGQIATKLTGAGTTQIATGRQRLCRVIVQSTAAGIVDFYDNTATVGTPVFSIPTNAATGTIYQIDCPLVLGLRAVMAATPPNVTVIWS